MLEKIKSDLIELITNKMNDTTIYSFEKWNYMTACYHLLWHYEVELETEIEDGCTSGYRGGKEEFEEFKLYVGYSYSE